MVKGYSIDDLKCCQNCKYFSPLIEICDLKEDNDEEIIMTSAGSCCGDWIYKFLK